MNESDAELRCRLQDALRAGIMRMKDLSPELKEKLAGRSIEISEREIQRIRLAMDEQDRRIQQFSLEIGER